jgi:hypothetical protein
MAAPLFILAPGRSYTSLISTILGQHEQTYGLPELNLNATETVQEWWDKYGNGAGFFSHGLLRAVAQIRNGTQTAATIVEAWNWLRARLHWSTETLYQELAGMVHPRVIVEKSPLLVDKEEALRRLYRFFPDARFIHLTRHPRSTCKSIVKTDWVKFIVSSGEVPIYDYSTTPPTLDPQVVWYSAHTTIRNFVGTLPPSQRLTIQGEAFLMDPDAHLKRVMSWLGLRTDAANMEAMKHPERSPFARVGPYNALGGNDPGFMRDPALRPFHAGRESLSGALDWRSDGRGFLPEVVALARELGYT